MTEFDVGIDPGCSKGHGFALYQNRKLVKLEMWSLFKINFWREQLGLIEPNAGVNWHIENVNKSRTAFNGNISRAFKSGMCAWAQLELERFMALAEPMDDFYIYPISSKWKGDRGNKEKKKAEINEFKTVTHWDSHSNADTRSAAYFGWLGVKKR